MGAPHQDVAKNHETFFKPLIFFSYLYTLPNSVESKNTHK